MTTFKPSPWEVRLACALLVSMIFNILLAAFVLSVLSKRARPDPPARATSAPAITTQPE